MSTNDDAVDAKFLCETEHDDLIDPPEPPRAEPPRQYIGDDDLPHDAKTSEAMVGSRPSAPARHAYVGTGELPCFDCHKPLDDDAHLAPPETSAPAPTLDLQSFWNAHSEWSQATFGTDMQRGPTGPLRHLAKEVSEALAKPEDELEMADCFLLVCDAARRSGLTCEQLLRACWNKLGINKKRVWPKTTDMNAAVEHER